MRKWYLGFLLLLSVSANIYANPANEEIKIRITDENQKPIFGVYFILKKQFTLLATSDMEGEGTFPVNSLQPSDTIVFQGIGYATVQYSLQELKRHPAFTMQELQYNLQEATATGISPKEILKKAIEKLQKIKAGRLPFAVITDRHNMKRSPSAGIRQSNTGENSVFTSLQAT